MHDVITEQFAQPGAVLDSVRLPVAVTIRHRLGFAITVTIRYSLGFPVPVGLAVPVTV